MLEGSLKTSFRVAQTIPSTQTAMLFDLTRYSPAEFKHETRQLLALALPMMMAQIATVAIGVADTAMSGAAGKDDLTAVALGSSVFSTLFITFMGIMAALNPIIAQQHGAGGTHEVGETGRQGIWFGLLLGIIGMAMLFALIHPLQNYLTMSAHIKTMFAQYLGIVALGLPAAPCTPTHPASTSPSRLCGLTGRRCCSTSL